ncbi:unnamed protein product, partial [Adineta steineri]
MITISPITPFIFDQLYRKYNETLLCPCSTTMVPYKNFVSQEFTFHPVCSSIFVNQRWIEALYLSNATQYAPFDFRATASSQLIILQNSLGATNQGNALVSSLNTNTMVAITGFKFLALILGTPIIYCQRDSNDTRNVKKEMCGIENPIIQGGFFLKSNIGLPIPDQSCTSSISDSNAVKGFFAGCTPFEGSFFTFLLITWLSTELMTIKVWNPSLPHYNNLKRLNSNTLICPCYTTTMPYDTFIALSPTLHQVCSSDFISDRWISVLKNSLPTNIVILKF